VKPFIVTAFFPDVKPAHAAFQTCMVKGNHIGVAALRALRIIRTRDGIAGKHIREIHLTIEESGVAKVER
jgi:hypothetical protein